MCKCMAVSVIDSHLMAKDEPISDDDNLVKAIDVLVPRQARSIMALSG